MLVIRLVVVVVAVIVIVSGCLLVAVSRTKQVWYSEHGR